MSRPDSFTNAMRGLLDPEAAAIEAYVAGLEADAQDVARLTAAIRVEVAALRDDVRAASQRYATLEGLARHRCDQLELLMRLGGSLANIAFNLSQCVGEPLSERAATALRQSYKEWDAAVRGLGAP